MRFTSEVRNALLTITSMNKIPYRDHSNES